MIDYSIDLMQLQVLPLESKETIYQRHTEIAPLRTRREKLTLDLFVGYCIDKARDMYILGEPDVCSFLSGKAIEEALAGKYETINGEGGIPDLYNLIEWGAIQNILDNTHKLLAHEVREERNDYGHAFCKILRGKLQRDPNRKPFTPQEAFAIFEKALRVLEHIYKP